MHFPMCRFHAQRSEIPIDLHRNAKDRSHWSAQKLLNLLNLVPAGDNDSHY